MLSPPKAASPEVTTLPSAKTAAKAYLVATIRWTCLSWSWTITLLPPWSSCPMWQSCYLQRTAMPTRSLLQLLWAAVPQQQCCLHFETQKLEAHRGQQAFGNRASTTAAQPFSDPKRCHPAEAIELQTVRWATTGSVARCWQVPQLPRFRRYICAFCCQAPWPKSNLVN